ncbi:MAG: sulfatase [Planctomycetota bacterium]
MKLRALGILAVALLATSASAADRPNVLFIAVDDLRPQLNCYGKSFMQTPNIDRLAARGALFERAYCMVPTCGASRAALMTSIRPARDRFTSHLTWAEKDAKGITTLNTHFKTHGYTTISLGKVFHHPPDNAQGWSEPAWRPGGDDYQDTEGKKKAIAENKKKYPGKSKHNGPAFECFDAPDENYRDAQNANKAIEYLERFSGNPDQPFFLAVGFFKPHLPFVAPKKYWDLYDFSKIDIPDNYHPPKDAPDGAVHTSGELRAYAGIPPTGPVDRETARKLIHGYYACVSFTDAQIGRVIDALDRLKLADNTIIVLWGDHGWQLGEHCMWNKHSCFETSMHAPLLVVAPQEASVRPGTRVKALTEFIDIYPSLSELAGLPVPRHAQGTSFVPLMKDPSLPGKPFAIGRFGPGDTIRTNELRFSEYTQPNGKVTGNMLYDHRSDPDENVNVAAKRPGEVKQLTDTLRANKGR